VQMDDFNVRELRGSIGERMNKLLRRCGGCVNKDAVAGGHGRLCLGSGNDIHDGGPE